MSKYIIIEINYNGDAPADYDADFISEDYEHTRHEYIRRCTNASKNTEIYICMILDSFERKNI